MQLSQTKEILQHVSQVEGRTPTLEITRVWHDLLKHVDFEVANKAALLALSDHNIHQVAPKHILAKVPQAVNELNAILRKHHVAEEDWKSEPQPICREHNLQILECSDCCARLSQFGPRGNPSELHRWAISNVYKADSLVGEGAPF